MIKLKGLKTKIKKSNYGYSLFLTYHKLRTLYYKKNTDVDFAKRTYRKAGLGDLNLEKPITFDEKIWWLKINWEDELVRDCTDKIKVRDYVVSKNLDHILNEVYGIYSSPKEIEWDKLPDEFYFKTNHSSATNIFIKNKNKANQKYINKRLSLYLKKNHYSLSREWNYDGIEPKIIAEKVLNGNSQLIDYRFFCSRGKFIGLFVDVDTADQEGNHSTEARRNVYDVDFNLLDVIVTRPRIDNKEFMLPDNINLMKEYAEILSSDFLSCRVDMYNIKGNIIFGELTFFHGGGINKIYPKEYNEILGSWIELPVDEN